MDERLEALKEKFERYISELLSGEGLLQKRIFDAMNYSLLAGGKRIRPILTLLFCSGCGGDISAAMPLAAAVEMVHTYSLIHDDLPCMDDDDLRRGRPTNHKVFGEANAVLAGDGLLTAAFETALGRDAVDKLGFEKAAKAAKVLADCSGALGMVGGQVLDVSFEEKEATEKDLFEIHRMKTGALIKAACVMGCIAGSGDPERIKAAEEYADNIGMAFQIRDDLLDAEGDVDKLGKNTGSDLENSKTTFYTIYGGDRCRKLIEEYTQQAKNSTGIFTEKGLLCILADTLAGREN